MKTVPPEAMAAGDLGSAERRQEGHARTREERTEEPDTEPVDVKEREGQDEVVLL